MSTFHLTVKVLTQHLPFFLTNVSSHVLVNQLKNKIKYSKTCLKRIPLGLKTLFSLDRCLVYTGSNYTDI
jgi:hypothetical protein